MTKLNLLPEHYVQQRFRNRMDLILTVAFAVVMGVVVAIDLVSQSKYDKSARQRDDVMTRVESECGRLESFHRRQAQRKDVLTQLENVSRLEERVPRSRLLAVLADKPEQICLTRLQLKTRVHEAPAASTGARIERSSDKPPAKLTPTVATPDVMEVVVTLSGLAEEHGRIIDYCTRLKSNPLVASATLGEMPRYTHYGKPVKGAKKDPNKASQEYYGFDITVVLRIDADALDLDTPSRQLAAGSQEAQP